MTERIEVKVNNIDIQLKTIEGKIKTIGEIVLSFHCNECHGLCKPILRYNGEHPEPKYNCEYCGEEYLIDNRISIIPHIGGREEVKLNDKMKPVINKIRKSEYKK